MRIEDLKEAVYDIVVKYFSSANVIWAEEYMAKTLHPLVTLKFKTLQIGNMEIEGEHNGEHTATYNCSMPLEVNLYTKGAEITGTGITAMVNTALSDLTQFVVYLHSPFVQNKFNALDICILLNGNVQDVSAAQEDNRYEYRAMAEFNVTFVTRFEGAYNTIEKTASGGGSDELINEKTGWFEEVEYEED